MSSIIDNYTGEEDNLFERLEDFFEACGECGQVAYSTDNKGVHCFYYNGKYVTLVKRTFGASTATLNGEVLLVDKGYVNHVLDSLGVGD